MTAIEPAALKRQVVAAYDRSADAFAGHAGPLVYGYLARPLAHALNASVDGPILDVAAGSGSLGGAWVDGVALDISAGQLATNPSCRRVLADGEFLPFRDRSFAAAASAFGINHFPDPQRAAVEMARVAPVVGLLTWRRPDRSFAPRQVVAAVLERRLGHDRSRAGELLDPLTDQVGTTAALAALLRGAGLTVEATEIDAEVPWPGLDGWLDYRLGMPSTPALPAADRAAVRAEVDAALAALAPDELVWRPRLVLAIGRAR